MSHGDVPSMALGHYWQALRRGWWVVVLSAVIGVALAAATLAIVPRSATARATVEVNVISSDPFNVNRAASELVDLPGESQVASSFAVAERAAASLDGATPASVQDAIEVTGVANTAILHVTATSGSPDDAQQIANAVATEFLAFRAEEARGRITRAVEQADERLELLRQDLEEVDRRLVAAEEGSAEEAQGETDRAFVTLQINAILAQSASLDTIDTVGGTLITPAVDSSVSWTPSRALVLISGLAVGLGAGIVVVFALGGARTRVRTADDVSQFGGRSVLGVLSRRGVTYPPTGLDLQELWVIGERLLANHDVPGRTGTLAVVDDTDDPSSVSLSLASVIAQSGTPVECVIASEDFRQFDDGLRLRLQPHTEQPATGMRYKSEEVPLLTFLVTESDALPFSARERAAEASWRQDALVLLTLGKESGTARHLAAFRRADAVLFVLAQGSSRTKQLQLAAQDARSLGARVIGSVLVDRHRVAQAAPATAEYEVSGSETAQPPKSPSTATRSIS